MSEFFRVHAPLEFSGLTLRELARRCHVAENTGNDVLLMQVQDELKRRESTYERVVDVFMEFYRELWRTEFAPKSRHRKRA